MRERSDEALMKAYTQGSMEAFELLYSRHRGPFYRYVLRLAGDPATANDLYQGSWEKIIKARGTYNSAVPFRPWIYRIAHNHVMDHFRRVNPRSDPLPEHLESGNFGPEEQLQHEDKAAALRAAVSRLPTEQRETLLLKLEAGLDLQDIADVTGVNRETAKSRLRYAVGKLKSELRE
jgi:RNA polymerase sigma-70 factor (ECF subfamily)